MKLKFNKIALIGSGISLAGIILICITSGWLTALGVVVLISGNNIERRADLNDELDSLMGTISRMMGHK